MSREKMKASITLKGKAKEGGANRIRDRIKSAFRQADINALVKLDNTRHIVYIEGNVEKDRLGGILEHIEIPYNIDYQEEREEENSNHVPEDYWRLKQRVIDQREQIRGQKGQISSLEQELKGTKRIHKNEVATLKAKLKDAEKRASHPSDVGDFVSETVARETKSWSGFVEFYDTTIETASEIYGINTEELEAEVLDHTPIEETDEYQEMKDKIEAARQANEIAENNPYVAVNPEAEKLLEKIERMKEKDKGVTETKKDLEERFDEKRTRVLISTQEDETSVILPFEYRGESISDYGKMEIPVLNSIKESLDKSKANYEINNFEGIVKFDLYDVPGTGKRVRNRIIKAISSCEDIFTRLGGGREVVRIEVG